MADEDLRDLVAGIKEQLERNEDAAERNRVEFERNRVEFERNRAFNREMLARYDQLARDTERRWAEETRRSREVHVKVMERLDEVGKEIRAQTEAIFKVLDWFESGEGPRPATP